MCVIAGSQGCVQQRLNFQVRPDEMAVRQTARFYIYGKGAVSKSTFEDPHFRTMTQAYYVAGGQVQVRVVLVSQACQARHPQVCLPLWIYLLRQGKLGAGLQQPRL